MERRAIGLSFALHAGILALLLVNFNFSREYSKPPSVILHIDLNKVQISDKTNLPQKAVQAAKKKVPVPQPKPQEKPKEKAVAVQPKPKPQPKPQPNPEPKPIPKPSPKPIPEVKDNPEPKPVPVPKPMEPVQNAVPVQETTVAKQKPELPKKQESPKKVEEENDLQSLLATVEKVRQQPVKQPEVVQNDLAADTGNTGLEGRLDQMLTISEKDFISSKLRECWNIDGGAQNLDEIVVEVKAYINKDGSVREVQILNKQNYSSFQSIADSAKRAVYICAQKGTESPFYILSQKYGDHYGDWKEIYLRFSPIEGVY